MSFTYLTSTVAAAGILGLAGLLWFLQRLRVQHRDVEVQSTLFWQVATEETRARVFVKRFRHWWAWLLFVAIASLMWMLLGQPQLTSDQGVRHVVLLDWSVEDDTVRAGDLELAMSFAEKLPAGDREILAAGTQLETLLRPNEPIELAQLRAQSLGPVGPQSLDWVVDLLASRASRTSPLAIHVVGDGLLDETQLEFLRQAATDSDINEQRVSAARLSVDRVPRTLSNSRLQVQTFGVSDAASGRWDTVDLWLKITEGSENAEPVGADRVSLRRGGEAITRPAALLTDQTLEFTDVVADGADLELLVDGNVLGALTIPARPPIRIQFESAEIPTMLRQLINLDPACEIVSENADVRIGRTTDADLQLVTNDEPSFLIQTETEQPESVLNELIDELALRQIDSTALAQQSGQVVEVQLARGDSRALSIWESLFSDSYDFRESRACPIFVTRATRWLANRPPLVEWAAVGERLPSASPRYQRAEPEETETVDGRTVRTTRLAKPDSQPAELATAEVSSWTGGAGIHTLFGILLVGFLIGEWILFQRGDVP